MFLSNAHVQGTDIIIDITAFTFNFFFDESNTTHRNILGNEIIIRKEAKICQQNLVKTLRIVKGY